MAKLTETVVESPFGGTLQAVVGSNLYSCESNVPLGPTQSTPTRWGFRALDTKNPGKLSQRIAMPTTALYDPPRASTTGFVALSSFGTTVAKGGLTENGLTCEDLSFGQTGGTQFRAINGGQFFLTVDSTGVVRVSNDLVTWRVVEVCVPQWCKYTSAGWEDSLASYMTVDDSPLHFAIDSYPGGPVMLYRVDGTLNYYVTTDFVNYTAVSADTLNNVAAHAGAQQYSFGVAPRFDANIGRWFRITVWGTSGNFNSGPLETYIAWSSDAVNWSEEQLPTGDTTLFMVGNTRLWTGPNEMLFYVSRGHYVGQTFWNRNHVTRITGPGQFQTVISESTTVYGTNVGDAGWSDARGSWYRIDENRALLTSPDGLTWTSTGHSLPSRSTFTGSGLACNGVGGSIFVGGVPYLGTILDGFVLTPGAINSFQLPKPPRTAFFCWIEEFGKAFTKLSTSGARYLISPDGTAATTSFPARYGLISYVHSPDFDQYHFGDDVFEAPLTETSKPIITGNTSGAYFTYAKWVPVVHLVIGDGLVSANVSAMWVAGNQVSTMATAVGETIQKKTLAGNVAATFDDHAKAWSRPGRRALNYISMQDSQQLGSRIYKISGGVLQSYDFKADAWFAPPLPGGLQVNASMSILDGVLYLFGGRRNGVYVSDVYRMLASGDFASVKSMPQSLYALTAVSLRGSFYIVQAMDGQSFTSVDTVYRYAPSADSWAVEPDVLRASAPSTAYWQCTIDGAAYVVMRGGVASLRRWSVPKRTASYLRLTQRDDNLGVLKAPRLQLPGRGGGASAMTPRAPRLNIKNRYR